MYNLEEFPESVRRRFMGYLNDGIMDLLIGGWIMLAGLFMLSEMVYLAGIWVIFVPPLAVALKRWITAPRLTESELAAVDTNVVSRMLLILTVGLLVLLLAGVFAFAAYWIESPIGAILQSVGVALLPTILAAGLAFVGYRFRQPRWYVYAALLLATAVAVAWFAAPLPWSIVVLGGIIIAMGLVVLLRFISSHPVLPPNQRLG